MAGTQGNKNASKLTGRYIAAAKKVICVKHNAIFLTDEELFEKINEELSEKERIHINTFQNWKENSKHPDKLDKLGKSFCGLIKRALREQKLNLFEKLKSEKQQWQKYAWILERKFSDWNIRQMHEHSGPDGGPIQVAANEIKIKRYAKSSG